MRFKRVIQLRIIVTSLLCLGVQIVSASQLADPSISKAQPHRNQFPYVVSLSVGPVWSMGGETQTMTSAPQTIRTYTANTSSNTIVDGELFLGIQPALKQKLFHRYPLHEQLGLAVATTSNANIFGTIWDDADPAFNNFTYNYHIIHTHIAVKGKLLTEITHKIHLYISGSLGVGFNQSRNFTNQPTIFEAITIPNFTNNTTTAFTYTVGIGLQRALTEHWQLGIGYEFADWGQSQLSRAPGQTLGGGLMQNHLYTNGLLFSVNYLA